jgi:hypothetical protein
VCCYPAYFADGLAHFGALFPQSELADQLGTWMARLLASQDADGYLGFAKDIMTRHGHTHDFLTMHDAMNNEHDAGGPGRRRAGQPASRQRLPV